MIARYRDGRLRPADGLGGARVRGRPRPGRRSPRGSTQFDLTGALEAIWELVRRLNRHVEQTAPWELAKDEARADELDRVLYELADGLRAVAVALAAFVPETAERILAALGQPAELDWDGVAAGRAGRGRGDRARAAALPAGGRADGGCVRPRPRTTGRRR